MNFGESSWKKFLLKEDSDRNQSNAIREDIIDYLISLYARNPGGKMDLDWRYHDFRKLGPEFKEDLENSYAIYFPQAEMFLINQDLAQGKVGEIINAIIHEIYHYNQHMSYNKDKRGKLSFIKSYVLPDGFSKKNIESLSFDDLIGFWREHYGYERSPHEAEAISWANSHTEEALKKVLEREKKLKQKKVA